MRLPYRLGLCAVLLGATCAPPALSSPVPSDARLCCTRPGAPWACLCCSFHPITAWNLSEISSHAPSRSESPPLGGALTDFVARLCACVRIEVAGPSQSPADPAQHSVDLPGTLSLALAGLFFLATARARERWLRAFSALAEAGGDRMTALPRVVLRTASLPLGAPARGDFCAAVSGTGFRGMYLTVIGYMGLLRRIASEGGDGSGAEGSYIFRVGMNGGAENASFPAAVFIYPGRRPVRSPDGRHTKRKVGSSFCARSVVTW